VQFTDLSGEGWPAFTVRLPKNATFVFAGSSVLTRTATFRAVGPEAKLLAELDAAGIKRPGASAGGESPVRTAAR